MMVVPAPRFWGPGGVIGGNWGHDTYFHPQKIFSRVLQFNSRKRAQFNHGRQNTDRDPPIPSISHPPAQMRAPHPAPPHYCRNAIILNGLCRQNATLHIKIKDLQAHAKLRETFLFEGETEAFCPFSNSRPGFRPSVGPRSVWRSWQFLHAPSGRPPCARDR